MTLNISASKHLNEVQQEFNAYFPYLKIEFFQKLNGHNKPAPGQRIYPHHLTISEARHNGAEGYIQLRPEMTVSELEEAFWDNYGLSVQVFRKSGNLWLETTMTDRWTLLQQNSHGKEISEPAAPGKPELPEDFELSRGED